MEIRRANLIPDEYLLERDYQRFCEKTIRYLMAFLCFLLLMSSAILSMCYYLDKNRDMNVPPNIKQKYVDALARSELLKNKTALLEVAKKEDCNAIPTLANLLLSKPDSIKLTRIDISNAIQIEGFSIDPVTFNNYVAQINTQGSSKATVEKISLVNGVNTFIIKAEKIN